MKKIIIAALLLTAAPSTAQAAAAGGVYDTWGLCGTAFPGLGFLGHIFLVPCRVTQVPGNA